MLEPPVPPGLGSPSAPQRARAGFLRLDVDLLAAAAGTSRAAQPVQHDRQALAAWIGALPVKRKDALLLRVVERAARRSGGSCCVSSAAEAPVRR
ncbi:hypothetical protein ACFQQB_20915 [Nonomuraea rubra]|uniref:hypothetical protein n=1 Tax=Nonomuraea rubra TaxID=46180 RepID=UPI003387D001